ncbi:hypothetical protein K443DRAFT_113006, partial [Laccaria amethystina LaAM-08-1]
IWHNIIQDQFVNFEKLYASMDRGYSHQDDAKDFAGGYALVRKDQYSVKKPIKHEAEWIRVFTAWKSGIVLLFPHCQQELQSYCEMVIDLFCATLFEPSMAIQFDVEARDRYAQNPYRMDDRGRLHLPLLAQMFRKREMADHSFDTPTKRATENIKLEKRSHATLLSKLAAEKDLAFTTQRAEAAAREGPRTLPSTAKHTNQSIIDYTIIDPPCFRRRFVWSDSNSTHLSPSALDTESAPPLPSPPPHLINDPSIQATLDAMHDFIKPLPLSTLLPNMKFSPMFVIWQNGKPRVVTDHKSSGLNDFLPRSKAHVKYDDMHPFGQTLRQARAENPGRHLILFKSDVASAFLNLPAHPIWQLRQIVTVDRHLYILLHIVVQLLLLWEHISCPFEDKKQDHGEVLKIIGFFADINRGSITLTQESIDNVISKIHVFLATPDRQPRLHDWQRLDGHLNWILNVLLWGRPALSELYRKTSGKTRNPPIFINSTIHSGLSWLADTIPKAIGVRFVDSGVWDDSHADLTIWTDANLSDAFTFTYNDEGFVY